MVVATVAIAVSGGAAAAAVVPTVVSEVTMAVGTGAAITGAAGSAVIGSGSVAGAVTLQCAGGASAIPAAASAIAAATPLGIGLIVLGAKEHTVHDGKTPSVTYTYDCWKPILHDESKEPSNGKILRDVVGDLRVKQTIVKSNNDGQLPEIILHNVWNEQFRIDYVMLPSQQLAAHAVRLM